MSEETIPVPIAAPVAEAPKPKTKVPATKTAGFICPSCEKDSMLFENTTDGIDYFRCTSCEYVASPDPKNGQVKSLVK